MNHRTVTLVAVFLTLAASVLAEHCYKEVNNACGVSQKADLSKCNALYSGVNSDIFVNLANYASKHITMSFNYLLMSANFGNYKQNREGFKKLYRKLSDSTWEDAIDLIKYTTKRGGSVDLSQSIYSVQPISANVSITNNNAGVQYDPQPMNKRQSQYLHEAPAFKLETMELYSLSKALDMHKSLATDAHTIHGLVTPHSKKAHDAELMSYLEKEFVHKHAETVRDLAGYVTDVVSLSKVPNPSLSIFMFDEYLQKVV